MTNRRAGSVIAEVRAANVHYARSFEHASLPSIPARHLAILTCMDARIDPAKALGLAEGDAHVIRNAGAIASDDAIRSLVISQLVLGTREVMVIGHTDCELETFTNDELQTRLRRERDVETRHLSFEPFADVRDSVRQTVRRIEETPLLPDDYGVTGFVYDVRTGRLEDAHDESRHLQFSV